MRQSLAVLLALFLSSTWLKAQTCTPDATTLCLHDERFAAEITWADAVSSGDGHVVAMADDWGYFWYTDHRYVDAVVKMLDGCGLNGHYWVASSRLSDTEQTLDITDTSTSQVRSYYNPLGNIPELVLDTEAFACDAPMPPFRAASGDGGQTVLELAGHFRIAVDWRDFSGGSGSGTGVPLTSHSGYFWFFEPEQTEVFVKLFDDYGGSGTFWVVLGAFTNIEFTVTVTSAEDGQVWTYMNPSGVFPPTVIDRQAFPSSTLFFDGFETGDTSAW
jgi:hypothetical protein